MLTSVLLAAISPTGWAAVGDDQYALAASHYRDQRWELAQQEFAQFLQHNASHPRAGDATFFLGESLVQQSRYEEAEPYFVKFLAAQAQHPLARQALFRLGETAYFRGEVAQAGEYLEKFRTQYPEDPLMAYALPYLAGAMLALAEDGGPDAPQHAAAAESLYRESLAKHPQGPLNATSRFGLARAQHRQGNLAEATTAYQELLDAPDDSIAIQANYYLATILFQQDQLDQAAQRFDQVLSRGPQTRWAQACHGPLAVCHARAGRLQQAREAFAAWQQNADRDPARAAMVFHLAEAALRQQDWMWAEQLFRMLTDSQQPSYRARGLSGLGWVQYHSDKPAAALESFQQLVREFPEDGLAGEAVYMQAVLLEQTQRPDEALAVYRKLLKDYPQHAQRPTAMLHAAVLLENKKQSEQAAQLYGQLIREHAADWPQIDTAIYRLAWLMLDANRPDAALQQFTALYQQHRDSSYWPDAAFRLASATFESGDPSQALELTEELMAAGPPDEIRAHAIYLQARIARAANDWSAVQKLLNRLVTDLPDNPLRATAEFWLAEAAYQQERFDEADRRIGQLVAGIEQLDVSLQPVVLLRQAQMLAQQKKWPESLQVARRVEAQFPEFPQRAELDYVIGRGLVADARFSDARAAFLRAAPRDGTGKTETAAMAQWMIGETYMHQENYQQALREYLRVEALYAYPQWQAAALLQAAKCYEQLNQPQQAAATYQQIVDKYPNQQVADEAARRLRQ
jgi:TolA-binding protein